MLLVYLLQHHTSFHYLPQFGPNSTAGFRGHAIHRGQFPETEKENCSVNQISVVLPLTNWNRPWFWACGHDIPPSPKVTVLIPWNNEPLPADTSPALSFCLPPLLLFSVLFFSFFFNAASSVKRWLMRSRDMGHDLIGNYAPFLLYNRPGSETQNCILVVIKP